MPTDKSLFFYGAPFHRFLAPQLAEGRRVAADLISEGSSVLDIGCGTGEFSLDLAGRKHCSVTGLDLSLRMLDFARKSDPSRTVTFVHGDAADLSAFADQLFDFSTLLMIVHELPGPVQARVLAEALRVAKRAIIVDSAVPVPKNAAGVGHRIVEGTIGRDHYHNYQAFLAAGGISGILKNSGLPVTVEHSSVFWHNGRQVVVVSKRA